MKPAGAIEKFIWERINELSAKFISKIIMNFLFCIWAVTVKDLRSELRVRYALNALLMFVVTSLAAVVIALADGELNPEILSAIFWIVILFSAMSGLSRIFVSEEERGTTLVLQLVASPSAVYFGKLIFNCCLTLILSTTVTLLYIIAFPAFIIRSMPVFLCTVFLGSLGFASASTIIAAIIAKAQAKNTLFTALAFPVLAPLLVTVIYTTALSIQGGDWGESLPQFQIMLGYLFVVVGFSFPMFDFVWKD
jgi:heme exporter protein B